MKPWVPIPRTPPTCLLAKDATGTEVYNGTQPTSFNWTGFTMGTVANGALVVTLALSILTEGSVALVWDSGGTNQSMTKIIDQNASANGTVQLWGLVNPTPGNKTLAVSGITAGTVDIYIDGISFSGVDQTGGATTFYGAVGAAATSQTANPGSITTAAGDATVDLMYLTVSGTGTPGAAQTQLYADGAGAISFSAASYNVGTAAPTFTWDTGSTFSVWADAATSVKAAAGSTVKFRRSLSAFGYKVGSRQPVLG